MKLISRILATFVLPSFFLLAFVSALPLASAQQGIQVGQVVNTNFSLVNRYLWTNDLGQIFTPTNTAIRLSDFDGKIVFFELFAVW
ncbi:MAG: hypothetical protein L0Z50_00885 [Verrucomicrobiales bacterium]|nr:hypothetical protein [Verrucomicrobiales bacterium]